MHGPQFRVPWRLQVAAYRSYQVVKGLLTRIRPTGRPGSPAVSFNCDYQTVATGATMAITGIANELAATLSVDAFVKPMSPYSRELGLQVVHRFAPHRLRGDVHFVDIEQSSDVLRELRGDGKLTILTCHALPTELHAVPTDKLVRNLELASHIHFVSEFQQRTFVQHYPQLAIEEKSFVIPNFTRQSSKATLTNAVGIVGHLNLPAKNGLKAVQLAQRSNASLVQCWGSPSIAGLDRPESYPKLVLNGWSNSIRQIHESFDVLLSTSRHETFGLVVAEALSAGIPCMLSDIPVFRDLYGTCPGVEFQTGDDREDVQRINNLLENYTSLKPGIIRFWEANFQRETVMAAWKSQMDRLAALTHNASTSQIRQGIP